MASALSSALWRRRGDAEGTQAPGGSRRWTNLGANCSVTAAQACVLGFRSWGGGDWARGQADGWREALAFFRCPNHSGIHSHPRDHHQHQHRRHGESGRHRPGLLRTPGTCAWLNLPGENTGLGKGLMPLGDFEFLFLKRRNLAARQGSVLCNAGERIPFAGCSLVCGHAFVHSSVQ